MPAFDCLGDPVRHRILGPCAGGDRAVGDVGAMAQEACGISRSQVERSTRGLHDHGLATVRDLSADA